MKTKGSKNKINKQLVIIGKKFNRLIVVRLAFIKNHCSYFECLCDCGNKRIIACDKIKSGWTKSCGCLRGKHKMSKTRFYKIWLGMKARCLNKNSLSYYRYGGRGIIICKKWLKFENFRDDMLESYKEHFNKYGKVNTTIERINNDGSYKLDNCKWATCKNQSLNQRTNHLLTYKNQTLTMSQWAEITNIKYVTLASRIKRHWSIKRALTTSIKHPQ